MKAFSDASRAIGTICAVRSENVTIELSPTTPGYIKAGSTGMLPIGSVNSYVTIDAGLTRIIAVVTAIRISEAPTSSRREGMITSSVRFLDATMIGRIDGGEYRPGLSTYPSLFAAVEAANPTDIARIFKPHGSWRFSLGEAVVSPGQDVTIDADSLLAKHCAVLGSTGSGKSCSVMAILDGLFSKSLPSANVVIFDANGEYAKAFRSPGRSHVSVNVIGGLESRHTDLVLPHWFMNNAEHLAIFNASEGAQAPLLQRGIADARIASSSENPSLRGALMILRLIDSIKDQLGKGNRPQEALKYNLEALHAGVQASAATVDATDAAPTERWAQAFTASSRFNEANYLTGWDASNKVVTAEQMTLANTIFEDVTTALRPLLTQAGLGVEAVTSDFDAPRYYSLEELLTTFLPQRIEIESAVEPRVKAYAATLLMRITRMLTDSRYNFFTRVKAFDSALGMFLRLILGWYPLQDGIDTPWKDSYVTANGDSMQKHVVTIVDLSATASDVLEHVTALIARLIIDLAQLVEPRGAMPVLLVLEEAHRYIPAGAGEGRAGRPREVFERIAKEGRKFGVSMLVASQRPSELSRTVLSQCGTLIAHRIVSEEDQNIIRHATPLAGRDVLQQLPGLASQHALVIGEAVPAPSYVRIRDVIDPPRSTDPDFVSNWSEAANASSAALIDRIAASWEQGQSP